MVFASYYMWAVTSGDWIGAPGSPRAGRRRRQPVALPRDRGRAGAKEAMGMGPWRAGLQNQAGGEDRCGFRRAPARPALGHGAAAPPLFLRDRGG